MENGTGGSGSHGRRWCALDQGREPRVSIEAESGTTAHARRTRVRWVIGLALTVVLTAIALPISLMAMYWLSISLHDYDTSGQGGPFRSCTADSTACSGMDPVGVLLSAAVLAGVALLIGFAGQALAAFPSKVLGRSAMTAFSAIVTLAGAALVWFLIT